MRWKTRPKPQWRKFFAFTPFKCSNGETVWLGWVEYSFGAYGDHGAGKGYTFRPAGSDWDWPFRAGDQEARRPGPGRARPGRRGVRPNSSTA